LSKLSISQIYSLSGSVYKENFFKLLLPAIIPTILLIGVSLIFYLTTLPTLVIDDISQYYPFTSYQALERILGMWYYIFFASIVIYGIMMLYSISSIMGVISDGLASGSLSLDKGARKGRRGFLNSVIPLSVFIVLAYFLLITYGRYSFVIIFIIAYFLNYVISSSVVDSALFGKNIAMSISKVVRAPIFSMVVFTVPLALILFTGGVAFRISLIYAPSLIFVIMPFVIMFLIPYAAIINAVAYLSLK